MILTLITSVLLTFWLVLCIGLFAYHYVIEVVADLPISGQSPCTAHTVLKQLIHRLIRESHDIPGSFTRPESRTSLPSSVDNNNETYEDLLATAIINKVISSCQAKGPSSSANSESSRLSVRDDKEYYFGTETLDSKWRTTDLDSTSVSSLEEWLHNNETAQMGNRQKYVDKVTLTIKQSIEDVTQSDNSDPEEDEDDRDYFQQQNLLNEDDTNWFLQKRQFQGGHSPVPVPMLVPDPTGDAKVLIGDKAVDDTSDLSDVASDYGDTEESAPAVDKLLVNSRTIIGGRNSALDSLLAASDDGELSADSGVREEKDFDFDFGSQTADDEPISVEAVVEAVNPSKDISVDDDNVEDESIISTYSNTEQDTEYTEKYASLPRRIEKREKSTPDLDQLSDAEDEVDGGDCPKIEFNGTYSQKEREKWKHAVKMDNNPYSKENIEKRLKRSGSSISSLFGSDYYKRQASAPAGSKAKNGQVSSGCSPIDKLEEASTYASLPRSLFTPRNSTRNFVQNPLLNFPDGCSSL